MNEITITITIPRSLSLARLCQALRSIGLSLGYQGNGSYRITETEQ